MSHKQTFLGEGTIVNCVLTADDFVREVHYNNQPLHVTDIESNWWVQKTVTFIQLAGDDPGYLKIRAEGDDNQACQSAGLLVHCKAADPISPWHNFKTNLEDWFSTDGLPLCVNRLDQAYRDYLPNSGLIRLIDAGATNMWVEGSKMVTLTGRPGDNKATNLISLGLKPNKFVFKPRSKNVKTVLPQCRKKLSRWNILLQLEVETRSSL